ncbi:MAG: 6-phosphofructokinase, partial [Anaerolineae bacterium]|nr:6-phosphofructokinase [Anaerolineae bacterium]
LHSTAHSHHRIIVVEIMGHNTGWLALGAGVAGGADVILIPEIPYDIHVVAESILRRKQSGKTFSIVAVSEGAMSKTTAEKFRKIEEKMNSAPDKEARKAAKKELRAIETERAGSTQHLTTELEKLTRLESRVTILGHVQRGGTPSPADRLLATRLGTTCAEYIHRGIYGVMVGITGNDVVPVPLEQVIGRRKNVPLDHPWIVTARQLGVSLGD